MSVELNYVKFDPSTYLNKETFGSLIDNINLDSQISFNDHLNGFTETYHNNLFDMLSDQLLKKFNNKIFDIKVDNLFDDRITNNYPNLNFVFDKDLNFINHLKLQNGHANHISNGKFLNFISSFNGAPHVSRQLLLPIMYNMGFFNPNYSSKSFLLDENVIDGHIQHYCRDSERLYRKFFLNLGEFSDVISNFDPFYKSGKIINEYNFQHTEVDSYDFKISNSFINLVSETMATSYYPYPTPKTILPIICKSLWVAYAPPLHHKFLEKYYGFKLYTKIFDYGFDEITNPVERIIRLCEMLLKFKTLSDSDWFDLYLFEKETIDYNYDWFYSRGYEKMWKEKNFI